MAALRKGASSEKLVERTYIDPWFIHALERIVGMERRLLSGHLTPELMLQAKRKGFSDVQISTLADVLPERVREMRKQWNITPVYKMVDTCAAEFEAVTPYFYSTYEQENEALPNRDNKAVVMGSGPIRIGQGIEFDYCSVHAAWALQAEGIQSIMVNSNPETVSTDFDTSNRLYFESLDSESVWNIIENETVDNSTPASVVQFGGQTAINLSQSIAHMGMPILGSSADAIDIASDRRRFEEFLSRLGIPQPPGATVKSVEEALRVAENIGYPIVVRPSYVLGGRAMEIVHTASELVRYLEMATEVASGRPILIDKYMKAKECEVDAVSDGKDVLIPGIMEHIERAGVHSGDSMAVYPGLTLSEEEVNTIVEYTCRIGVALNMRGLMNVQFVIEGGSPYRSLWGPKGVNGHTTVYVLEVNPRSSRTVPFISKVTGVPMVRLATRVMLGKSLREQGYKSGLCPKTGVVAIKAPVFSMSKLVGVDTYLGPEMKSTGEVMGIDWTFQASLVKALIAAGLKISEKMGILMSIADRDKADAASLVRQVADAGCPLYATVGTAAMIRAMGIPVTMTARKLGEGTPTVLDVIHNRKVGAVINTVAETSTAMRDGFEIRRAAVERRVPCFTSLDTARAAVESMLLGGSSYDIMRMEEYLTGKAVV
jgi:carbamoyl-phosphate synthase large subunit